MRLHRLEIEGFGPFRERQVIDFDAFADDGIFLIAGRTGAGKSSILDAVCFGLYGGVPRYESGEKRLRSDHCEPDDVTEVVVEFSTPAGRFRVTRSPEYLRPAKRGGGMTKQASAVSLEEQVAGEWVGRAARAVDVANELDGILQLSQQQFLQVILLAQNRFARFLLADSKERQQLLRKLFGTERFEDVQARFDERRRASEQALGQRRAVVAARLEEAERVVTEEDLWGTSAADATSSAGRSTPDAAAGVGDAHYGEHDARVRDADGRDADERDAEGRDAEGRDAEGRDAERRDAEGRDADQRDADERDAEDAAPGTGSVDERLERLRRALARAEYRTERRAAERDDAEKRHATADAALAEAREQRDAQAERDRARAALAALDAQQPEIADARRTLERARAAEGLRSLILAAARAADARDAAALSEEEARAAWLDLGVTGVAEDVETLRAWAAERTRESGAWERAARLEAETTEREAALAASRDAVEAASATVAEIERERSTLPARLGELTEARDAARREADRAEELGERRDAAVRRLDAAREKVRLTDEHASAERELSAATTAHATAQSTLAALRQRRLDGFAGELATRLVPGEPCAVCGAIEHPAPAAHTDPVSADDISAAEAERDRAAQQERAAADRVASLRAELAAASALTGDRTVEQAEAELAAATEEHASAVAAAERRRAADDDLQVAQARAAAAEQELVAAQQTLAAARETLVVQEQRCREADEQIAEARGDHASVAERVAEAAAAIAAASRYADAGAEQRRRADAAVAADAERDAALADSPFDDAADAEAALRSGAEREALDARITAYAVQRETEKAILLPLEMRTLPEEPIDVTPVELRAIEARAVWVEAVDAANRAEATAARLAGLIDRAAQEHERSAGQAAEHEVLRGLADVIAGRGANTHKMTLETFVLAAELEEIVEAANRRLSDMSTGRYQLRHSDALAARGAASGLGIVVFDAFTGQTRPAQSLSGGETFLGSLALALGLAEVVTARAGGIRLDTLFVDEGFGSLDADTLEVAMRTLDELRQGGRTVGVISHVEAMQEQIPAQLTVRASASGPSVIEMPSQ